MISRNDSRINNTLTNVVLVAFLWGIFCSYAAHSEEVPQLPENIAKSLKMNASELDPLSITWKRSRSSSLSARELLTMIGYVHSWSFLQPCDVLFKWQDGCAYLRNSSNCIIPGPVRKVEPFGWDNNLNLKIGIDERSFDGKSCYGGNGPKPDRNHDPGLIIEPLELVESQTYELCYPEFLGYAGIAFPRCGSELKQSPTSSLLRLLEQGCSLIRVQDSSVNGKKSLIVDLRGKGRWPEDNQNYLFSYTLLPDYRYAVQRIEQRSLDGKLLQSVENNNFMIVPGRESYLPKKSTVRYYTWISIPKKVTEQPLLEDVFTVDEVNTQTIDKKQFCLRESYRSPGTNITDNTLPSNKKTYVIPANPEDIDRVIEEVISGKSYRPAQRSHLVQVIVVCVLAISISAFIYRRRWK
jgi:hypothetical protein